MPVREPGQMMSGPDPLKPVPSATAILRNKPEDINFETDFADLAARFAAKSGGGLTAELSADLALEIVLNEIVEQAGRITGATGAAILFEREGEMVCRASSGLTAPDLGSPIDTQSGLAGECLRTRRTQCCDDALQDPRADLEASERLGVRSVMVMPLIRGECPVGLFELFSTQPFAFGVRDERTLEVLAEQALNNLERASRPVEGQVHLPAPEASPPDFVAQSRDLPAQPDQFAPLPEPNVDFLSDVSGLEPLRTPGRQTDAVVRLLGVAVLAAAVLLGIAFGRHLGWMHAADGRVAAAPPAETARQQVAAPLPTTPTPVTPVMKAETSAKAAATRPIAAVPPGGLVVFEKGKEVFRLPPTNVADQKQGALQLAAETEAESVLQLPADQAEKTLLTRVEPQYPEAARQQKIQGNVVLDVHVAADGSVQDVQVVGGPPQLAPSAIAAVKQWKFRPSLFNGRPAEMQTRISLNFNLPQ